MSECIFCKIAKREIPATILYEDETAVAFLDIAPIIKGHVLVIPKNHFDPITQTPDEVLAHLHVVAKKLAQAQMDALDADGVNIMQNNGKAAGQEVSHLHIHVIPRFSNDSHHWNWNPVSYKDSEEMSQFALALQNQI